METINNNNEKYQQAKERVHKIKSFYTHLTVYILVNTFITGINIYYSGFERVHFSMFSTWFFWGIGIFFHAMGVFGKNLIFSRDWEKRKINDLMEQEENEMKF